MSLAENAHEINCVDGVCDRGQPVPPKVNQQGQRSAYFILCYNYNTDSIFTGFCVVEIGSLDDRALSVNNINLIKTLRVFFVAYYTVKY